MTSDEAYQAWQEAKRRGMPSANRLQREYLDLRRLEGERAE